MVTQIESAFLAAQRRLNIKTAQQPIEKVNVAKQTQFQIVWEYIKAHPDVRSSNILIPGMKMSVIYTICNSLLSRGMIKGAVRQTVVCNKVRSVYYYTVAMKEYSLLPMTKKPKVTLTEKKPMPAQWPAPKPDVGFVFTDPTPEPAPPQSVRVNPQTPLTPDFLDNLTVRDAKLLYQQLKEVFG